ncbi:DUF4292 domain-containing protein [Hymenobacter defluvii]|uniref:DUF4292 domain-containing protein n=1 Tax=Hymenobacter defluvii TaxID=2054411 RepID=UPI001AAFF7F0|nr:DUF4292 domain-containing protein [Hymenobacter defluvii]
MSKYPGVLLLLVLLVLGSCQRKLTPTATNNPATTATPINPEIKVENIDFRYLTAKGKAQVDMPSLKQTVNINVRMRKDSIIWMSLGLAGFEGVRARITRDSIQIMNKLQREYYAGNFAYLKQQFNVEVTFEQLQALLLGNYLPAPAGVTPTVVTEGPQQRVEYAQSGLLLKQLIELSRQRVKELTVTDPNSQNSYMVNYTDFQALAGTQQQFAYSTLVQVKQGSGASTLSINYRNVDLDKERLSFPFSVPSGYTRKK